jgi:phosphomannomutase
MPSYFPLFKSYDIRGTYPVINGTIAYWVGFSFVKNVLAKESLPLSVSVVHDHRNSSPELYKCLLQGIVDAGGKIIPLGLGSTDMLYAATQVFENAGIMITASHNPPADNGIKIVKKAPQVIGIGTGLEAIRDSEYFTNLKEIDVNTVQEFADDNIKKEELIKYYKSKIEEVGNIGEIREKLKEKELKIVVDTGNGMGGYIMKFIKELYPEIEFIPLFWELDGNYPNHPADPLVDENVSDLRKAVVANSADLGIAFDGDCDRVFFIDEKGERLIGDFVVSLFAKYFLDKKSAGIEAMKDFDRSIVYNIPASTCTKDTTESLGGKAIAAKQGHNHMKAAVYSNQALYGGEHSGHHYFGQFRSMDGGALALAAFINLLLTENKKASELTKTYLEKYLLSGEINFHLEGNMDPKERVSLIEGKLKAKYPDAEFNYLDGISIFYPNWKFNIRLSNTEPLLRLNVEVKNEGNKTREDVNKKVEEIKNLLDLK